MKNFMRTAFGTVISAALLGQASAAQAATATGTFSVSIVIQKACSVTAGSGSDISLGTVASTATNVTGNNTISVTCSKNTPYFIGLAPSNSNTAGAGSMAGTGGNTDTVPYQLRSTSGMAGTVWGNTATTTTVGNGVAGTGSGAAQTISVYATVASANYTPDTYTDTVTVTVNY